MIWVSCREAEHFNKKATDASAFLFKTSFFLQINPFLSTCLQFNMNSILNNFWSMQSSIQHGCWLDTVAHHRYLPGYCFSDHHLIFLKSIHVGCMCCFWIHTVIFISQWHYCNIVFSWHSYLRKFPFMGVLCFPKALTFVAMEVLFHFISYSGSSTLIQTNVLNPPL